MTLLHKKQVKDPINPKDFQSIRTSKLFRSGITINWKLSEVTPFPKQELDRLKALGESSPELKEVDFHTLPLLYTTQLPISRGQLIDVASSLIYLIAPLPGRNGGSKELGTETLTALISDFKALASEKIKSGFLDLMVGNVEASLSGLKTAKNGDFLREYAENRMKKFEKYVSDIEAVVKTLYNQGLTDLNIYKKLNVDLDYMMEMRGFVHNTLKKIQSVRADLHKKYFSLEQQLQNIRKALEHTDPHTSLDKVVKLAKWVFGSVFLGSTTVLAAKGELLGILNAISQAPNLIYVSIIGGLVGLGLVADMSIDIWKANRENHYIKKYEKKQDWLIKKAIDYGRRQLKVIGFKSTKEAVFSGYLEAAQDEVSTPYLVAAHTGDFDTINAIYDRQSDRMIGEHTLAYYFRLIGDWLSFGRFSEKKMEAKIKKEVLEADGFYKDIIDSGRNTANSGSTTKTD